MTLTLRERGAMTWILSCENEPIDSEMRTFESFPTYAERLLAKALKRESERAKAAEKVLAGALQAAAEHAASANGERDAAQERVKKLEGALDRISSRAEEHPMYIGRGFTDKEIIEKGGDAYFVTKTAYDARAALEGEGK